MNKKQHPLTRLALCAATIGLLGALAGCVGYTLGTTLPHDIQTLHVSTFRNQTTEPMIENTLTDATIARFQFDGSVRIAEEDAADALLEVTLLDYRLEPLAYERDQQARAREYRAWVLASVTMTRLATDEVVVHRPRLEAETTFPFTGDMTSSKARALPDLAEELARRIVDAVTQTW